ncbi:MAG: hypothetical protein ACYC3E_00110 [Carboxydocellales bacterium]
MAYAPTTWLTGDIITATKLNNMEAGIAAAVLRAGDTMTAQLLILKNIGLAPNYATGQLQLQSSNGDDVLLGFHRSGFTACALVHKDGVPGLYLVDSVDALTELRAGNIYSGGNTVYHAGIKSDIVSSGTYVNTSVVVSGATLDINIPIGSGKTKVIAHFKSGLGLIGGSFACTATGADTVSQLNADVRLRSVSGIVLPAGALGTGIRLSEAYIIGANLFLRIYNEDAGSQALRIEMLHWTAF